MPRLSIPPPAAWVPSVALALVAPSVTLAAATAPAPATPPAPMSSPATPPAPMSDPDTPPEPEPEPESEPEPEGGSESAPTIKTAKKSTAKKSTAKKSTAKKSKKPRRRSAAGAADATPGRTPIAVKTSEGSALTIAGYIETFYSFNFNRPSNGLTNYRAFDNQHNAFTLQNTALDAAWESEQVYARLALQVGHAPNTYYGVSEPSRLGGDGVGTSDASLFRTIQQAHAGFRPFAKAPVFIEAGVFLSPIGFEGLAIHDNWHWSHSPLFFALPFYHSGLKVGAELGAHRIKAALYNGWNNVTDNNSEKSLAAEYEWDPSPRLGVAAVYFTGVERPTGAPEGRAWRHLLNLAARGSPIPRLGLQGAFNAGFEPNLFGLSRWLATAASARFEALPWLFVAGRGSLIHEVRAAGAGVAAPILVATPGDDPTQWMAEGTLTLDLRPTADHVAIKLEYRHDRTRLPIFYRGEVAGAGLADDPFIVNARSQNTLTLGLHAWF